MMKMDEYDVRFMKRVDKCRSEFNKKEFIQQRFIPEWSIARSFIYVFLGMKDVTYGEFVDESFKKDIVYIIKKTYFGYIFERSIQLRAIFEDFAGAYLPRNEEEAIDVALILWRTLVPHVVVEAVEEEMEDI